GVTIEDVSSELVGGFDRAANYLVDGSGFDESLGTHTVAPDGFMWLNTGTFAAPNDPNVPGAVITFDLEANYDLGSLTVWNYNETLPGRADLLNRGTNEVEILIAASEGGAFTSLGDFNFTVAPGVADQNFGQIIDLSTFPEAGDARLVRFNITSNHGGDNNFVGLSEVRFDGTQVPEPSAGILALIGLAGCLRRRR
ncbi:PEP-CTERM sorting domain-containing protein, partial [bacterium]|nr:PEP-CTERM sorting domain-containing protein [bacterium]